MPKGKPKNTLFKCEICGEETHRTNNNQKYCRRCAKEQHNVVQMLRFKRRYRTDFAFRKKHWEYAHRWYAQNGRKKRA